MKVPKENPRHYNSSKKPFILSFTEKYFKNEYLISKS